MQNDIPETLYDQLVRDEGQKAFAYDDATGAPVSRGTTVEGFVTIGIGVCIDSRNGSGLTPAEIQSLCQNRIDLARAALLNKWVWARLLDAVRQDALVNMVYQMGIDGLAEFHQAMTYMQILDFELAAEAFLDSEWAETQSPARAQRLAEQIRTGVRQ